MDAALRCRRCASGLNAQTDDTLCANCLLKLALDPPSEEAPADSAADSAAERTEFRKESASFAAESTSPSQTQYFGDYQLLELIGRGGMGVVYKARQRPLNRLVALKMVINWRDASLGTLARFQIEARAAARLDHPNIVHTYQIGELNGQPYFTMKLIPGESLAKRVRQMTPPAPGEKGTSPKRSPREAQEIIATLMSKVAHAVAFAHQQGVIHRDLKPSNILIDAQGHPHLTDFGVAKLLELDSGLTQTNELLGTPAYMAPEQISGKVVSASADVYSLGAMLYELLTGKPPLRGRTPLETLRKAAEEVPVSPVTLNGNVDVELAAISLKCLEKKPLYRYASAQQVAEDLERWLRHEPTEARSVSLLVRCIRWGRRNPIEASLIATLCVGLAGTLILLGIINSQKAKTSAVLREVQLVGQTNAQLLSLTISMLHEQLEGLWLSSDRRVLQIRSEQLAALSGLPIIPIPRNVTPERLRFGLSANESPVSDSRRYAPLLFHLEDRLSDLRQHPVRIDLHIFKYKDDRSQALVTSNLDLARMGTVYYLKTKQQFPGIQALVEMEAGPKSALFFTRSNSGIQSLSALKGRRVAFGDPTSSVTFWGEAKLADAGVIGRDLEKYIFLDSRSEFIEEAHELGPEAAIKRRRWWLHSTADVIEEVVSGQYDAGMTTEQGLAKHQHRGLVRIPGSEFERRPSPWVAREGLPADLVRDFVSVITGLENEGFMLLLPNRPSGFNAVTEATYARERDSMQRLESLFPIPRSLPTTPSRPTDPVQPSK